MGTFNAQLKLHKNKSNIISFLETPLIVQIDIHTEMGAKLAHFYNRVIQTDADVRVQLSRVGKQVLVI